MTQAVTSPYLVPFDGTFRTKHAPTQPPEDAPDKKHCKKRLKKLIRQLDELQRLLYANNRFALLLIFQAMDAAGKDSTIRAVMNGVDPSGCQVYSFKQPSSDELDHDFLWRTTLRLPGRGNIGIFNRSYYEEVLVVRVHPHYLNNQRLSPLLITDTIWNERFESIVNFEQHLHRNGTVMIKFFLNVSKDEQRRRFLSRLETPEKHWKFATADVEERNHWQDYHNAYEDALNATARPWAPWYTIPADDKAFMRMTAADIIVRTLQQLDLFYPQPDEKAKQQFHKMKKLLNRQ